MPSELRPSQALRLWHDVILDLVRDDEPDLSARQQAVLMTVYLEPPPHTVRDLAAKLSVTKPAITRALDTMGRLGLLKRRRDQGRSSQCVGAANACRGTRSRTPR